MECRRPECAAEYEAYAHCSSVPSKDGGYDWVHCCSEGCHEFFWRGKNGFDCCRCELQYCDECLDAAQENDDGEFVCAECVAEEEL